MVSQFREKKLRKKLNKENILIVRKKDFLIPNKLAQTHQG